MFYFLRHSWTETGRDREGRVIESREYSYDLEEGWLQIPISYHIAGSYRIVEISSNNIEHLVEENTVA